MRHIPVRRPIPPPTPTPAFKPSVVRASAKAIARAHKIDTRNRARSAKGLPPLARKSKPSRHHPDCMHRKLKRARCDCNLSEGLVTPRTSSRFVKTKGFVNVDHLPKNKRYEVAVKLHEVWERKRARARRMDAQTAEGHARLIVLGYPDLVGEAKVLAVAQPDYARGLAWLKKQSEVRIFVVPHDADTAAMRQPGRDVVARDLFAAITSPTYEACMIELRSWLANERERRAALRAKSQAVKQRWPILRLRVHSTQSATSTVQAPLIPNP